MSLSKGMAEFLPGGHIPMELDDYASTLSRIAFFEICDDEQLRLLAFASEERSFKRGDVIYSQGGHADGAYVLINGIVAISDDATRANRGYKVSGPNVMVGELALVLNRPRRKSVTAATDLECLFIPRGAFVKLMRQYPDMASRAAKRIEAELDNYLGLIDRFRDKVAKDAD